MPVPVLLDDLKAVVMQERLEFLRVGKPAGNVCFLLVIVFSIVPASIGCPVDDLGDWIVGLCGGNGDLIPLDTDVTLIELFSRLIGQIVTGWIARLKRKDTAR